MPDAPRAGRARLIYALDVPSLDEAKHAVARLRGEVGMLKVGLELFVGHGEAATRLAGEHGLELFLDLKLHDIPETVGRAVRQAVRLGARYVTVHASGGRAMLREAVRAVHEAREVKPALEVVAVTVLTSLDAGDLVSLGIAGSPSEHALTLATLAWEEGVRAFVCSPDEASLLRAALGPTATILTPGIRPSGSVRGDQKRVRTPAGAIAAGADRIVVGRPIRDADDPAAAARAIALELEVALKEKA